MNTVLGSAAERPFQIRERTYLPGTIFTCGSQAAIDEDAKEASVVADSHKLLDQLHEALMLKALFPEFIGQLLTSKHDGPGVDTSRGEHGQIRLDGSIDCVCHVVQAWCSQGVLLNKARNGLPRHQSLHYLKVVHYNYLRIASTVCKAQSTSTTTQGVLT